ncbi:MAG: hypothetical protein WCA78_01370 [Rhizomicrobium sp.]
MKRVREYLPVAALGSTLLWMIEHLFDKGIEHVTGIIMQAVAHLPI